ncbi:MAG TPA: heparan-alpha-glucosaminide N-acetyltransferase domain-containing protein [Bryobacteraceae bacterium]|nr:heparan-alpha-glucosaminide N-acetyltransferase domain-containing protein [Bryobacteraceae bacterium]
MSSYATAAVPSVKLGSRLSGLDALRGAVMILMALDHVRDFLHVGAMSFSATDLSKTTPLLFFTRWITHFCLPTFMFTAGAGAFLWWRQNNRSQRQLSRFLWTRGIWFVFLELTVMQLAYDFRVSLRYPILLLVLWIFGICMIAMAALVRLPMPGLLGFSVAVIVFHNCLDGISAARFGAAAWLWNLLHQPGFIAGNTVLVTYTLLPWIGVMAGGFCFGRILLLDPPRRQRIMRRIGSASIVAFIALRAVNRYGDPAHWSFQKGPLFTFLSFLNCSKYPASLDFLLMTLGPALLVLAWLDRIPLSRGNPFVVFGRVPMFYFILHLYLIHLVTVIMALLRYGTAAFSFAFNPVPSMGGPAKLFPANFGYGLLTVYGIWIMILVLLYPLCRWFAKIKSTHRSWWLSYL